MQENLLQAKFYYRIKAFDFDEEFYSKWSKYDFDPLIQQGIRETFADQFENHLNSGFRTNTDLAFETNFHDKSVLNYAKKY